jgi:limonene-1,2-epoxide hydrolase
MELIRVEWIVANITEGANGIVFLERENRVDGDRDGERSTAVFEIRDGLIASWREYVDLTRGNPTRRSGYPVLTDAELQAVTAMLR